MMSATNTPVATQEIRRAASANAQASELRRQAIAERHFATLNAEQYAEFIARAEYFEREAATLECVADVMFA